MVSRGRTLIDCNFEPLEADQRITLLRGEGEKLELLLFNCLPWTLHDGPCRSNARVVVRTSLARKTSYKEAVPEVHPDSDGRLDLRLCVAGYGRVYLHRLVYWFINGRCHRDFRGDDGKADWSIFERDPRRVDHGSKGRALILDYRKLGLQSASASARQGHVLAAVYKKRGGLRHIQNTTPRVRKRPARR